MSINRTIYDTQTLVRVLSDLRKKESIQTYWLDLLFPSAVTFDSEYIEFDRLSDVRKIAPLVVPTAQGRPVYSNAERVDRVKPAYIKVKDTISATRMFRRHAGLRELTEGRELSPQQRYRALVAAIASQQMKAIQRRWEWMAARAAIDGKVTLEGEAYPKTVVDFRRQASNTITLAPGSQWGDSGVSILDNIEAWVKQVREAPYAGIPNRLTVGTDVWAVMRKDPEIKELLNINYRQGTGNFSLDLGMTVGDEAEYVGTLNGTIQVWVYSGWFQDDAGNPVPLMSSKDIVLSSPAMDGVKCFGAIQDYAANLRAMPMFPSMWDEKDPSATFHMIQSAPLMVPVNPNAILKATVVS